MSSAARIVRLTEDEYLRAEGQGDIRHEFVRGRLFDMVGGTDTHNLISLNMPPDSATSSAVALVESSRRI